MWMTTGLVCLVMLAGGAPNFTGRWKLNEAKTPGGNHRGTVFVIEHTEPRFRYTATGQLNSGAPLNESFECTTDGKSPRGDGQVRAVGRWEGSTLVMDYVKGDAPIMTFRFRMSADGREMFRDAELKDGRRIHEIYDRQ